MFRILSMDGGGAHAGIMARALGRIYGDDTPGRDIVRQFELIAGNSGGSIVMTALCCDYSPAEIARLYADPATLRRLFSPKGALSFWISRRTQLIPRLSSVGKRAALIAMFDRNRRDGEPLPSTIRMADWPGVLGHDVKLLVTAFDYDRERAAFFRSDPDSRAASSTPAPRVTLADAVHASTNAPVAYYDLPAVVEGGRYWDGAIAGNNDPVFASVVETLANAYAPRDEIVVLSLGNQADARPTVEGRERDPWTRRPDATSVLAALKKWAGVIADEPPNVAPFHAHVALGQPLPTDRSSTTVGNLVRLCPSLGPRWDAARGAWTALPGISDECFASMSRLPLDAMDRAGANAIRSIADHWLADAIPNQPIRSGDHGHCDVGHDTFSAGRRHWMRLAGLATRPRT